MSIRRPAPNAAQSWLTLASILAAAFLLVAVAACQSSGQDTGENAGQNAADSAGQDGSEQDTAGEQPAGEVAGLDDIPDYMIKGDPDAPVTMFEWSDYQ
jgi:protein-disulfide isomerase